jgi:hypothetical protein
MMWSKEDNADDRRFLKDIDPIINIARNRDLAQSVNLIGYFCKKVAKGDIPDIRVVQFALDILILSLPKKKLAHLIRNHNIKQQISVEQKKGFPINTSRKSDNSAALNVANRIANDEDSVGEDRIIAINYQPPLPIITLKRTLSSNSIPELKVLKAILPDVENIYHCLLRYDTGKRIRSRLKIIKSKVLSLKSGIGEDMINDVKCLIAAGQSPTQAYKTVAKEYKFSAAKVSRAYQRHLNK